MTFAKGKRNCDARIRMLFGFLKFPQSLGSSKGEEYLITKWVREFRLLMLMKFLKCTAIPRARLRTSPLFEKIPFAMCKQYLADLEKLMIMLVSWERERVVPRCCGNKPKLLGSKYLLLVFHIHNWFIISQPSTLQFISQIVRYSSLLTKNVG